jgi:hypothetical protein
VSQNLHEGSLFTFKEEGSVNTCFGNLKNNFEGCTNSTGGAEWGSEKNRHKWTENRGRNERLEIEHSKKIKKFYYSLNVDYQIEDHELSSACSMYGDTEMHKNSSRKT